MTAANDPPVNADAKAEAELQKALELARRLEAFSQQPLDHLAAGMRTWPALYRSIVYGVVRRKAEQLEAEARAAAEAEEAAEPAAKRDCRPD